MAVPLSFPVRYHDWHFLSFPASRTVKQCSFASFEYLTFRVRVWKDRTMTRERHGEQAGRSRGLDSELRQVMANGYPTFEQ